MGDARELRAFQLTSLVFVDRFRDLTGVSADTDLSHLALICHLGWSSLSVFSQLAIAFSLFHLLERCE